MLAEQMTCPSRFSEAEPAYVLYRTGPANEAQRLPRTTSPASPIFACPQPTTPAHRRGLADHRRPPPDRPRRPPSLSLRRLPSLASQPATRTSDRGLT